MTRPLPALLCLALLAGCTGPTPQDTAAPACTTVAVPAPTAGSHYTYATEGWAIVPGLRGPVVGLEFAEPPGKGQRDFHLPRGSSIEVAFGDAPEPRIDGRAGTYLGWHLTYWVHHAEGWWAAYGDEWLNAGTLRAEADAARAMADIGGLPAHLLEFWNSDRPGALLSTPFWGRTLADGDHAETPFFNDHGVNPDHGGIGSFAYTVTVADCVATVQYRITYPFAPGTVQALEAKFEARSALPVLFRSVEHADFRMELAAAAPGSGAPLGATSSPKAPQEPGGGPMAPADEGFPRGVDRLFPTGAHEAVAAAQAAPQALSWFFGHPDAEVVGFEHSMGRPGSDTVDEWVLTWRSPATREGYVTVVTNTTGSPPPLRLSVLAGPAEYEEGDLPPQPWFDFTGMAAVHQSVYGAPPEFLGCRLPDDACQFGTHKATGRGYAPRGTGGGMVFPGLMVWLSQGALMGSDALGPEALGPPVARQA